MTRRFFRPKFNIFVFVNQGSGVWEKGTFNQIMRGTERGRSSLFVELTNCHLPNASLWGSNVSGRQRFVLDAGIICILLPSQGLDHGMNGLKLLSACSRHTLCCCLQEFGWKDLTQGVKVMALTFPVLTCARFRTFSLSLNETEE